MSARRPKQRRGRRIFLGALLVGATTLSLYQRIDAAGEGNHRFDYIQKVISRDSGKTQNFVLATVIVLTTGTSFTRPGDWNQANNSIECYGGSGGGAGGGNFCCLSNAGGGGGGGGGYSITLNVLIAGTTAAYSIGAPGTAGSGGRPGTNGGSGGTTSFAGATSATGGNGGLASNGSTAGAGGGGGTGTRTGGTGGSGNVVGSATSATGGGGGGCAGTTSNGGGGSTGGAGSGGGGQAGAGGGPGVAGNQYGGGGGGGGTSGGLSAAGGGVGFQGVIVVTYVPFFPGGYEPQRFDAKAITLRGRAAAVMPREDGIESPFVFIPQTPFAEGWQVQPPQPPNPFTKPNARAGATMRGDDGTEDRLNFYFGIAWQIQPVQPPTLRYRQRIAGLLSGDAGDQDDEPGKVNFFPQGWEIQSWQPPNPLTANLANQNKTGALMRGDDGNLGHFFQFVPIAFEMSPWQPPHPPLERRPGAVMLGDPGNYAAQINFVDYGFSVLPPQPPHPAPERRAAAVMPREDGISARFVPVVMALTFLETQQTLLWTRQRRGAGVMPIEPGNQAPFPVPAWGWHTQGLMETPKIFGVWRQIFPDLQGLIPIPSVPPNLADFWFDAAELVRPQRRAPVVENEPSYVSLAITVPWGLDHPEHLPARRPRGMLHVDEPLVPFLPRITWGWERGYDQIWRIRRVALDRDSPDLEPPARVAAWGWEPASLIARTALRRFLPVTDLVGPLFRAPNQGWEEQNWQPPRFSRARADGWMPIEPGEEAPAIIPVFSGWEPALFWPPHPRPERAASILEGDISGAWGPFVYLVPSEAIAGDFAVWLATPWDIGLPPPDFVESE